MLVEPDPVAPVPEGTRSSRSATVALRPRNPREQRGDLRHAGGQGSETLAHVPALFVELLTLFGDLLPLLELSLAKSLQDVVMAP